MVLRIPVRDRRRRHRTGPLLPKIAGLARWYDAGNLGLADSAADPEISSLVAGVGPMTAADTGTVFRDGTHRQDGLAYVRTADAASGLQFPLFTPTTTGVFTLFLAAAWDETNMETGGGNDFFLGVDGISTTFIKFKSSASGTADQIAFKTPSWSPAFADTTRKVDSGWRVWEIWSDGANIDVKVNGKNVYSLVQAIGNMTFGQVFATLNASLATVGSFGALAIYDRALIDAERILVRDFFIDRWSAPFLIDPTLGDDTSAEPWDPAAPYATINKPRWDIDSGAGEYKLFPGDEVLLKRGEILRERLVDWFNAHGTASRRIKIGAYGTGDNPIIQPSTTETGPWANTTGTEYSTALAVEPVSNLRIYWDHGDGTATILERGTAASLAANEFDWAASTLHVNIGSDPTGELIEIPDSTSRTLYGNVDYMIFNNIDVKFGGGPAVAWNGDFGTSNNVNITYNYEDAWTPTGPNDWSVNNLVCNYNGQGPSGVASLGDGITIHGGNGNTFDNFECRFNSKGITNFTQVNATFRRGLVQGNIFADISPAYSAPGGTLTFEACVVHMTSASNSGIAVDFTSATILDTCDYVFKQCTFYDETDAGTLVQTTKPGVLTFTNCAFENGAVGLDDNGAGSIANTYCGFFGVADLYANSASAGTGDLTATVGLTDPANGNYEPDTGSEFIDAGTTGLGVTTDYLGNTIPSGSAPDMGAVEVQQ